MVVKVDINSGGVNLGKTMGQERGLPRYTVLSTVFSTSVHCQPSRRMHHQHLRRVRLSRFVAAAPGVLSPWAYQLNHERRASACRQLREK